MSTTESTKLVKTITESAVVVGLAAGIGYVGNKLMKEPFINDPSKSVTNYAKWVVVLSASMYSYNYLVNQKIIPASI